MSTVRRERERRTGVSLSSESPLEKLQTYDNKSHGANHPQISLKAKGTSTLSNHSKIICKGQCEKCKVREPVCTFSSVVLLERV